MSEVKIISQSFKDFLSPQILKIAIIPLVVTLLIMFILFFGAADFGLGSLDELITQTQAGQEVSIDPNAPFYYVWAASVLTFFLQYSITAWLAGFLLYTVGTYFILMFSVFLTIAIIGFLTPAILAVLHKRHYSHLELNGHGSVLSPLFVLIKSTLVMILMFIIFIPLYFIPLINLIALNLPFYYFFHKLLNYDVASTMLSQDEYKEIRKSSSMMFRIRTLILFFISMVPFITLFSAVFYIVYLGNAYFIKLDNLRKQQA